MDPFKLLKADHEKVAGLFDRLESRSGKAKLVIFKQIKSELELHTHIEEKVFYPALEKPQETHDLTLEAYEEHAVVKALLSELGRARTVTDEWKAKAKVLRENVEHHVKEEENELFDKADDALESDELEALGDRMAAEKARKQGRPASAFKGAKSTKSEKAKPGIIATIANFVGLGSDGKSKQAASKSSKKGAGSKASKSSNSSSGKQKVASKTAEKSAKKPGGKKKAPAKTAAGTSKSSKSKTAKR
jgi:hypothetical protein